MQALRVSTTSAAPRGIVVTDCGPDGPKDVIGRTLAEIASARNAEPERVVIDLLLETGMSGLVILHYADRSVVKTIAGHSAMLVGSDAVFATRPHPRLWGTAPRFLGRYAIREGIVTVREAVARLSFRAARRVGLDDRGRYSSRAARRSGGFRSAPSDRPSDLQRTRRRPGRYRLGDCRRWGSGGPERPYGGATRRGGSSYPHRRIAISRWVLGNIGITGTLSTRPCHSISMMGE